jgi:histidine triad (HIT) family protein
MKCFFCKIAGKEANTELLYEDADVVAFKDINPQAPSHVLIIPKKHIATLNDASEEDTLLIGKMQVVAKKIAKELGHAEDGYRTVMNCNVHGGQTVFHIHLHLLGGRQMGWPPG